jgi:hypothetical protein
MLGLLLCIVFVLHASYPKIYAPAYKPAKQKDPSVRLVSFAQEECSKNPERTLASVNLTVM